MKRGIGVLVALVFAALPASTAFGAEGGASDNFARYISGQVEQSVRPSPGQVITVFISAEELKEICKAGGWEPAGLKNQGQCVSAVEAFLDEGLTFRVGSGGVEA
jgi:hypothetical protein